jgi:methyl-accepting chemotaxis protein
MDEVVGSVRRVSDIIGEIAAASDEQRAGIEQINGAIVQMDQVTQQNAALVEEAAAAADAMQDQARELAQLVATFRVQGAEPGSRGWALTPVLAPAAIAVRPVPATRKSAPASVRREPVAAGDDWETF